MDVPETEKEVYSFIKSLTRGLPNTRLDKFTTSSVSKRLSISRNLASHYLNDLVRMGEVVKAGLKPVYYFSKVDLERFTQYPLGLSSYASVEDVLPKRDAAGSHDFSQMVGSDLSLASSIEKLKAAVTYPSGGLPVLICGERGTGKTTLAKHMFDYGLKANVFRSDSKITLVDCARYADDDEAFSRAWGSFKNRDENSGWFGSSGGLLVFRDADRLSPDSQGLLLANVVNTGSSDRQLMVAFLTTHEEEGSDIACLLRAVPVIVHVPSLHERSSEEREELVLRLLKEEGRKLGKDVLISHSAFRCLVGATFQDNIQGLRSCVTSCCASAFLESKADGLEIQAFMLPGSVLDAIRTDSRLGLLGSSASTETDLIDTTRIIEHKPDSRSIRSFSAMLSAYHEYERGSIDQHGLIREVLMQARDYGDYLTFDSATNSQRAAAYERVLANIIEEVRVTQGVDLSKKAAVVLSRCIHSQVHLGSRLSKWRNDNSTELTSLMLVLLGISPFARFVTSRVASMVEEALGLQLDVLSRILVFSIVFEADQRAGRRQSVGIILCHGYSTASSIADAANRILASHVYEAIDMSYDQEVEDILVPLNGLLQTYLHCKEIAILVDMGSLEGILDRLDRVSGMTVGVMSNASTALALEVGAGLAAGEPLSKLLPQAAETCRSHFSISEAETLEKAIVFCSDGGIRAAERIRGLVEHSLQVESPIRFLMASTRQLQQESIVKRYDVIAVIGTDDPAIEGTRFLALEDIIAGGNQALVDDIFGSFLTQEQLEEFHENLVKNLTLRNVIESITILNPERLLDEVERAMAKLQEQMKEEFNARTRIGLCVHLCCLVERLVTHSTLENYTDVDMFVRDHGDFVSAFNRSFEDIARQYNVEVPPTEIAYVFDYIDH